MLFTLLRFVVNAISLLAVSKLVPGFTFAGFGTALLAAVILGLVNAFIRPLLLLLTLPINILTLGLFTLVLNGAMLLLVAALVPGFHIDGIGTAVIAGIVLWLISLITNSFLRS